MSARSLALAIGGWRSRDPAYEALADAIRLLCLDNRLPANTVLPAERELAARLGVSRTTVASAYASLRVSGHIDSVRGSGSTTLPLRRRDPSVVDATEGSIDLQQASPAAWPGLAGVLAEAAADAASVLARRGYDLVGSAQLRSLIADRYTGRGIPTSPDEVLVTSGAQSAIDLLAGAIVGRGDRVIVETPTYPHAADALRRAGARLVGIPVSTAGGWDMDHAAQAFARALPVLAYVMPDFQNPTGQSMTTAEREQLRVAAERAGTILVVDETTADLDIDRPVREGFDPLRRSAVRIGSLGKTVWGGLRVGWLRADADLIRRLAAARPARDLGTPEFEQSVATRLLPRFDEILHQRSQVLRSGRDTLEDALRSEIPQWRTPHPHGGVSMWVELDAPLSPSLVMEARTRGLLLTAGPRFALDGGHEHHLRLPFTAPEAELVRAAAILAQSWRRVRSGAPVPAEQVLGPVV